ncbi:MAG: asparagine synthase (glutamine-hydrolyzing), partial [Phycisphaeraceae bacterium]|nr:asparagine synthase (glutamine-hydrolyzing) [Phycisphaeraceae bacterium]
MCGIAGILRSDDQRVDPARLEAMNAAQAHRGPDGSGTWVDGGIGFGHRRLAIIGLGEQGHQPMASRDECVWLTYNGEIYNYRELRGELEANGAVFRTETDTEVIIHAWRRWGTACVERFRGMFAFALADLDRRELFLARDRFGIKPLVYRQQDGWFAFASELPALEAADDRSMDIDLAGVDDFLRFKYIPAPRTIWQQAKKLPAGHRALISFEDVGRPVEPERWWDWRQEPSTGSEDESTWVDRLEEVFTDSVKAHLVADVDFGVFLSGGVDSTLVAWKMSELLDRPVKAFAIGFEEEDLDELPWARQAAGALGVELVEQVVTADAADHLPQIVAQYGEPFADASALPTWHLARLAREHVPMVLSGDGGDELFGGYHRYAAWRQVSAMTEVAGIYGSPLHVMERLALAGQWLLHPAAARRTKWQRMV